MTGRVKHYTLDQLAAISREERIVWVRFPEPYAALYEQWVPVGERPDGRPRLANLVAYAVVTPSASSVRAARASLRRAWTFRSSLSRGRGTDPSREAVDPASIEAGRPCRLVEG
jgi:hypothetical protein